MKNETNNQYPVDISSSPTGSDLVEYIRRNKDRINKNLLSSGAILFRNFEVYNLNGFYRIINEGIQETLIAYSNRSTPRTLIENNIYTSTEYPASQLIPLHNENSYTNSWPKNIFFYCIKASCRGGNTPIADSRKVYININHKIRERFAKKGVLYVRNYGELGLSWNEVFQTSSKKDVGDFCEKYGITYEWIDGKYLRTLEKRDAIEQHPITKEKVWFNQAHLFHASRLEDEVYSALLELYGKENLPRNSYYGDGSEIEVSIIDEITEVYNNEKNEFPWQEGDLLMLDNMLTAHGRNPYSGEREIIVGMTK